MHTQLPVELEVLGEHLPHTHLRQYNIARYMYVVPFPDLTNNLKGVGVTSSIWTMPLSCP